MRIILKFENFQNSIYYSAINRENIFLFAFKCQHVSFYSIIFFCFFNNPIRGLKNRASFTTYTNPFLRRLSKQNWGLRMLNFGLSEVIFIFNNLKSNKLVHNFGVRILNPLFYIIYIHIHTIKAKELS